MIDTDQTVAADILIGAVAIGRFLFPNSEAGKQLTDKQRARKVYHLAATSKLPVFRLGSTLCARRSVLIEWIAAQEARHAGKFGKSSQPLGLVAGHKS